MIKRKLPNFVNTVNRDVIMFNWYTGQNLYSSRPIEIDNPLPKLDSIINDISISYTHTVMWHPRLLLEHTFACQYKH